MGLLGLFRKKEEKKPETELPPAEVKFSGLSEWLSQELSEKIQSARKKSGELQEGIARGFSQIRDSAVKLGKSEFEKSDKTYAAVNSVKDTFAKRTQSISGKCPEQVPDSYSGMREFHKRTDVLIKELMNISPRQGAVISNYFRKESSSVMKNIKSLNSVMEEFQRFLDYEGKSLFILEEAERISRDIREKLESAHGLEKRGKEIGDETRGLKEAMSGKEKNLDVISKDSGWKSLEEAKKEKAALEGRARDLKFRIGEELSSAKRPLKKYLHLKSGELSMEERNFLKRFVKSPLKTLMGDNGADRLKPFLLTLMEMLDKGINLKDREVGKLKELIKRLESGEIGRMMEEYSGLLGKAAEKEGEMEKDFSDLSEERKQAESGVNEAKEGIRKLENELKETQEKARNLKEEMGKDSEKLENLIYENINRKVNIVLNNGAIG